MDSQQLLDIESNRIDKQIPIEARKIDEYFRSLGMLNSGAHQAAIINLYKQKQSNLSDLRQKLLLEELQRDEREKQEKFLKKAQKRKELFDIGGALVKILATPIPKSSDIWKTEYKYPIEDVLKKTKVGLSKISGGVKIGWDKIQDLLNRKLGRSKKDLPSTVSMKALDKAIKLFTMTNQQRGKNISLSTITGRHGREPLTLLEKGWKEELKSKI